MDDDDEYQVSDSDLGGVKDTLEEMLAIKGAHVSMKCFVWQTNTFYELIRFPASNIFNWKTIGYSNLDNIE